MEARERAMKLMKEGKGGEAKEFFQRCLDITPEMAQDVIRAARDRNVDCIVAPYEADAQLAYIATSGIADFIVTEDSDLTLFGCERVLYKMTVSGDCVLYEKEHLNKVFGLQADLLSFDKFRYMCITAGCDYLANLPGIGLGKAKNFWLNVTNPDLRNVLWKIPAYLKMPQVSVTQDYIEGFIRANNTFLYQLVFDPVTRKEKPLTPYPADLRDKIETLTYAGTYSPPEIAAQMALGNMNIRSQKLVDNFDPDMIEMNLNESRAYTKYGKKALHRSMWCRDYKWLDWLVRKHYGDENPLGLSVPEFTETLLTLLSSNKSAEALQTEMVDLCGFERFDMIGAVLENREALVRSLTENKASMKAEILSAAASVRAESLGPVRPNFGCQVTVQSEEERALVKQIRKEEKKINRLLTKNGAEKKEEEFVFNPLDRRAKRQAALDTPLFKERQAKNLAMSSVKKQKIESNSDELNKIEKLMDCL